MLTIFVLLMFKMYTQLVLRQHIKQFSVEGMIHREKNITWNFLQCRRWQLPQKIHLVADYAGMVILTFVGNGFGWF